MTTIARELAEIAPSPSVVTIGNFDGVHRGHQVLLRRAVAAAEERGMRAVAVTFEPHPAAVLRPGTEPPRLQPLEARIAALEERGVDLVVVLGFTPQVAAWSPEHFVERVLVDPLQAVRVVVGTNFRYGHRASGDVVTLTASGEAHGFGVEAVTLLDVGGEAISSTALRRRLGEGDVAWAAEALGRPFSLAGRVVAGDGRGRTIGVPTANLDVADDLVRPADGVYACWALAADQRWPAVTNIGVRPTFDTQRATVEAHVIDAAPQLYDREVTLEFVARIRPEQRFSGPDELVAQITRDIEAARQLLAISAS